MKILEFLVNFIPLDVNPVANYIISTILVALSGSIAYWIGGLIACHGKGGTVLWLVMAFAIYAFFAFIVRCVMWFISLPWWVYVIILAILLVIVAIIILVKRKKNKGNKSNE